MISLIIFYVMSGLGLILTWEKQNRMCNQRRPGSEEGVWKAFLKD